MSAKKLRLMCLVWPDVKPSEHIVDVKIDNETIAALKELIKDKHAHSLAHVDARDLTLWKCSISDDSNLKETLDAIHFDDTHPSVHLLGPLTSELCEHFPTVPPPRTIHILVELPALKNEVLPLSLPDLLKERQQFNAKLPEMSPLQLWELLQIFQDSGN
ncbi:hypothetical protein BYT27DRAFT_7253935 [Phlegmacium glaucopus]|nr:hypothetical protein BYT27DRAFT_7253935 [Phlegmacium glaucopus]